MSEVPFNSVLYQRAQTFTAVMDAVAILAPKKWGGHFGAKID